MDSSLINLIPNLVSRRSAASQRREPVDAPPRDTPDAGNNPSGINVPLRLELCLSPSTSSPSQKKPLIWSHDATIAIGSETTYRGFLALLRRKIGDMDFFSDLNLCHAAIVAEVRGRTVWRFGKQDLDVTSENWDQVMQGMVETRFRGFEVVCWDEDDLRTEKP
jgi:hypothetical protein